MALMTVSRLASHFSKRSPPGFVNKENIPLDARMEALQQKKHAHGDYGVHHNLSTANNIKHPLAGPLARSRIDGARIIG